MVARDFPIPRETDWPTERLLPASTAEEGFVSSRSCRHPNVYTLCLHRLQFYLSICIESFSLARAHQPRTRARLRTRILRRGAPRARRPTRPVTVSTRPVPTRRAGATTRRMRRPPSDKKPETLAYQACEAMDFEQDGYTCDKKSRCKYTRSRRTWHAASWHAASWHAASAPL